jgi:hypothetical protein
MRDNNCSGEASSYLGHFHDGNKNYRNKKFMAFIINDEQKLHVDELVKTYDITIDVQKLDVSTGGSGFATAPYLEESISLEHLSVEVFDDHIIKVLKPVEEEESGN